MLEQLGGDLLFLRQWARNDDVWTRSLGYEWATGEVVQESKWSMHGRKTGDGSAKGVLIALPNPTTGSARLACLARLLS